MRSYTVAEVRRAVERLKRVWRGADRIRYGKCHCRKRGLMLSCVSADDHPRGKSDETCGFWCDTCGFTNAGSRPADPAQDDHSNWNDDSEATR